jgi:hypothetical protein
MAVSPYRVPYGGMHDGGQASPKQMEDGSWPQSVDLNADLRLTKCILPTFRGSGERLWASRKAAGKPPGKQPGASGDVWKPLASRPEPWRRLAAPRILACTSCFKMFERKIKADPLELV